MRTLQLRAGRKEEAGLLSDLALRSKGHWGSIPGRLLPVLEIAVTDIAGC